MKGEASGEISVEIFYDPTQGADGAPPSDVQNIWSETSTRELPVAPPSSDGEASPPTSASAAPAPAPWTYNFLAVSVLEGAGLKACDG